VSERHNYQHRRSGWGLPSREEIERALNRISPNCSQDVWWRVGAAVYAALGDAGFDLFDEWSSRSETKYPGRRECWKKWYCWRRYTIRGGGDPKNRPIGVGTLFYFAKWGD
jgi:hypothetical protein